MRQVDSSNLEWTRVRVTLWPSSPLWLLKPPNVSWAFEGAGQGLAAGEESLTVLLTVPDSWLWRSRGGRDYGTGTPSPRRSKVWP